MSALEMSLRIERYIQSTFTYLYLLTACIQRELQNSFQHGLWTSWHKMQYPRKLTSATLTPG